MSVRQQIKDDLFTNSLLISPISNEEHVSASFWVKKNSMFSCYKEKTMNPSVSLPYYQCTLLDYLSTIQLIICKNDGNKIIYEYGPLELQNDLASAAKLPHQIFHSRVVFNKKETFPAQISLQRHERNIKICFILCNGIEFTLNYPYSQEEEDYENLFRMEEYESTSLEMNFLQDKRLMVGLLKKLKIYSYQGTFLKLSFKNQCERDVFLLNFLKQAGFDFQVDNKTKSKEQNQSKTQESRNKENQALLEMTPISFINPPHDNSLHDICEILSIPKLQTKLDSPFQKRTKQFDPNDSFDFEGEVKTRKTEIYPKRRKNTVFELKEPESSTRHKKIKRKSQLREDLEDNDKMNQIFFGESQFDFQQQMSKQEKKPVTKPMNLPQKKESLKPEIPEFLKVMKINKAIHKNIQQFKQKRIMNPEVKVEDSKNGKIKLFKIDDYGERSESNSPLKVCSIDKKREKPEKSQRKQGNLMNIKSLTFLRKYNDFREKYEHEKRHQPRQHFRGGSNFSKIP